MNPACSQFPVSLFVATWVFFFFPSKTPALSD